MKLPHHAIHQIEERSPEERILNDLEENKFIPARITSNHARITSNHARITSNHPQHSLFDFFGQSYAEKSFKDYINDDINLDVDEFIEGCGSGSGNGSTTIEPYSTTAIPTSSPSSAGLIAGVVVGVVVAVVLIVVVIVIWMKRRRMFCFQSPSRNKLVMDSPRDDVPTDDNDYVITDPADAIQEMTKLRVVAPAVDDAVKSGNIYEEPSDIDRQGRRREESSELVNPYEVPIDSSNVYDVADSPSVNRKQDGRQSSDMKSLYVNTSPEKNTASRDSNLYDIADTPDNAQRDEYTGLSSTAGSGGSNSAKEMDVEYENTGEKRKPHK